MLSLITVGAFAYLIQKLDPPREGDKGGGLALPPKIEAMSKPPATTIPVTPEKPPATESGAATAPPEQSPGVKLTFVGDVMFGSKVDDLLQKNGYDYPYKHVKPYLEKADITVANLETPITTRGAAQEKEYVYRSSPQSLPELKRVGVDLVNLANNHSMDYGVEGLLDTLDYLDAQDIKHVGAGRNSDEAYRYVIMEQKGMKIAFLGFSRVIPDTSWYAGKSNPGMAETYSTKLAFESIGKARAEADLVVVIAHWGEERKAYPVKSQTDLARQYIDHGADLIVASHPHVVQGFEQYKGKWIAYSMGNFIFTTNDNPNTWESMILEASCTKERSCDLSMVPILTKWAQPIPMVDEARDKLLEKLTNLSVNAQIDKEGRITLGPTRTVPIEAEEMPPVKKETGIVDGTSKTAVKPPANGTKKPSDSDKAADPKKAEQSKKSEAGKTTETSKKPDADKTQAGKTGESGKTQGTGKNTEGKKTTGDGAKSSEGGKKSPESTKKSAEDPKKSTDSKKTNESSKSSGEARKTEKDRKTSG
ncbi:poly-gamma-glutamate synthesis protein (capsule biosynthesis protein) [Paenibacillus tianmuensis]|uniref:Poly-gamma-glutamate synthesis protein (Capsule biosynthesis protein) n=1 Tax=Paenibacillus tianmuensis TaxID=624147 RepID=A0A1G4RRC3_9BACL|nr:CapA family protein [Paenibacillus tianmuensis]SCW59424.1 poly-gamma-glutamate synthesis protein (capsule biosynthesis protein) [Paenibacillus tianmuensis]